MNLEQVEKYSKLMHAVQTGVAYKMNIDPTDTEPKHLRVGINSAMIQISAIVRILIDKGVFTEEEYYEKLIEIAEDEVQMYKDLLSAHFGTTIDLR